MPYQCHRSLTMTFAVADVQWWMYDRTGRSSAPRDIVCARVPADVLHDRRSQRFVACRWVSGPADCGMMFVARAHIAAMGKLSVY